MEWGGVISPPCNVSGELQRTQERGGATQRTQEKGGEHRSGHRGGATQRTQEKDTGEGQHRGQTTQEKGEIRTQER